MKISRDDIIAIINYKCVASSNRIYLKEMLKQGRLVGNSDYDTIVITEDKCYMVKPSSRYIMKKLNKSQFLKAEEENNEERHV